MERRRALPSMLPLLAALVAMVVVPLVALGLLGHRLVRDQEALWAHELAALRVARLKEVDASIQRFVSGREQALLEVARALPREPDAIRAALAQAPQVDGALVVDLEGRLLFPPLGKGPVSESERELLERTRTVWEGGVLPALARAGDAPEAAVSSHGWQPFWYGGGLHLLLWRADGERVVAVELSRVTLMAELVGWLPATDDLDAAAQPGLLTLADGSGRPIYRWGAHEPGPDELPAAELALSPPLASWSLVLHTAPDAAPLALARGLGTGLLGGLLAVALALVGLATWLWREQTRELRLARQRVSFVNQVSHELKTPLTSIRLYAELLESRLEDDDDGGGVDPAIRRHLDVIVGESQRLSRLITDVLTFARGQEGRLAVRRSPGRVDAAIESALATFRPSLDARGVVVDADLGAAERVLVDHDAVEQVLTNLLSNVEKYAADGGHVAIHSQRTGSLTRVTVRDRGPGIPDALRARVFEPFYRVSDRLTDGATGTGIGLDIARRLARLHGGDLVLLDPAGAGVGCAFELTLDTPDPDEEEG